jgi:hypothetical protein
MVPVVATVLQTTVAMGGFYPSLLCYHCSDAVVAIGRLPVATVAYGPLPQCMFVVVKCGDKIMNKITFLNRQFISQFSRLTTVFKCYIVL